MHRHLHEQWYSEISGYTQTWTNTRTNDQFEQTLEVTSAFAHSGGPTMACGR